MKHIVHILTTAVMTLLFIACDNQSNTTSDGQFNSSSTTETNTTNSINLPTCSVDIRDASASLKVPNSSTITALEAGTKIRLWHYDNSDKLACVISGKAVIN